MYLGRPILSSIPKDNQRSYSIGKKINTLRQHKNLTVGNTIEEEKVNPNDTIQDKNNKSRLSEKKCLPTSDNKSNEHVLPKVVSSKFDQKYKYHNSMVIPFLNKKKAKADTLVFIFTTGDEYIRRAFQRMGWIENPNIQSAVFDLRWDLNENNVLSTILLKFKGGL